MINIEENNDNSENQLLEKSFNVREYIKKNIYEYKNIIKIIILCFCLIIIIIPSSKKTFVENEEIPDKYEPKELVYNSTFVNLYIITHKDFKNTIMVNPVYKILCDERTQVKREYSIDIIPTNTPNNILYQKRIGYCEGAKMYYIWQLYKSGNLTSKYVGFMHYRRIFNFLNNIPDLDSIFRKFDAILIERSSSFSVSLYDHFKNAHFVHFLDESIEIIQEKFNEYTPYIQKALRRKWGYFCNIFIMKKDDFIKWGDFVFGILLELDKRYNLTTDEDIKNLIREEIKKSRRKMELDFQSRLEGFILERLSMIFYEKNFPKRYEIPIVNIGI